MHILIKGRKKNYYSDWATQSKDICWTLKFHPLNMFIRKRKFLEKKLIPLFEIDNFIASQMILVFCIYEKDQIEYSICSVL